MIKSVCARPSNRLLMSGDRSIGEREIMSKPEKQDEHI